MTATAGPAPGGASDAALLERLRGGDQAAYAALVREHGGRMLSACRRILGNDEDAQDALQDAFVSAFRAIRAFHGQSQLGTWLHRIAINAALMKRRSGARRREQEIEELLPSFTEHGHHVRRPGPWDESADAPAVRAETRALVRGCIERLPESYRVALVLRDIEGLANDELAEQLGTTVNAAKIRVHRARQALRELLDPHFGGLQP
jgi:RNA polymerase sigma-70 factor, ECF subfamily